MEILDYVTIENLIPKDVCETVLEKIKQREEWNFLQKQIRKK